MIKFPAIIIDLDGTLANCDHRRHHLEKKDWPAFFAGMVDDTPNHWCERLIHAFTANGYRILLVSGRPRDYYKETAAWLDKYKIFWTHLFMRPPVDYRNDAIIKKEIYQKEIEPYFNVLFCVDDRQRVVDAWRELGLVCLQCDKGDF